MANTIFQLRRSSVAGKQPTTSDVAIGELAINLSDKKIYSSNGTAIFEPAANVTNLYVGNSSVSATVNSTVYTGTANNSTYAFGKTEGNLNVNNALTSNNSTYLNGQLASYYTNATNITTGTLPYAQIPANVINTTSSFTITGVHTHNANIVIGTTAGISANGTYGSDGQYLTSNGSAIYWSTSTGAPTYVRQNFTGDGTTTSFTVTGGYTTNNIDVYLNGVKQRNGTDVTVSSGTAVVFAIAPANGALIDAIGSIATLSPAGVNTDSSYIWTNTHTYGNSTVNTTVNSSLIAIGNSTVNTQIVAGNVYLNGSTLVIGNSTVNTTSNGSVTTTSSGNSTASVSRKTYSLSGLTTSNTETELLLDGSDRIPISNSTTVYYNVEIVGRANNFSDSAAFTLKGVSESRANLITSFTISNTGTGFFSTPTITVSSGTANLIPVINKGKITDIIIFNTGQNYSTTPTLTVSQPPIYKFNGAVDVTQNVVGSSTNNCINYSLANSYFTVGDRILYYTDTGVNVVGGLTNNTVYVIQSLDANTISLATVAAPTTKLILTKSTTSTSTQNLRGVNAAITAVLGNTADVGQLYEIITERTDTNFKADVRANNSTNSLNIYVTGNTGKNIFWSALVNTTEVRYV